MGGEARSKNVYPSSFVLLLALNCVMEKYDEAFSIQTIQTVMPAGGESSARASSSFGWPAYYPYLSALPFLCVRVCHVGMGRADDSAPPSHTPGPRS